jgi:hypothetical protein
MSSGRGGLKGFGGRAILELVDDFDSDTYRAVYTVGFTGVVYVLHAFQKKAKKGIATPRQDLDLVKSRLRDAELHYRAHRKRRARREWRRSWRPPSKARKGKISEMNRSGA